VLGNNSAGQPLGVRPKYFSKPHCPARTKFDLRTAARIAMPEGFSRNQVKCLFLWFGRNTKPLKLVFFNSNYSFDVNKIRAFAQYAFVRTDSDNERDRGNYNG
jgi:hypothetical protein